MTTWTREQIGQAERLTAKVALDDSLLTRHPEVAEYAADKMARQLTHMAHPFAIELHRDDFEVQWTRDDATPWQVMGEMRWRPTTNAVELRGGHLDGVRYAVQKVGEPLRIPRAATTPWWTENEESATAGVTGMADTYELVGWREEERVWVYEAR
jgi:hypothetical protein